MPLKQESYLQRLLNECDAFFGREEKEAKEAVLARLTEVYKILKHNIKDSFAHYSQDVFVRFIEIAVEIDLKFKNAEEFI